MRIFNKIVLSLILVLVFSTINSADPIRIISGTASTSGTNINFVGQSNSVSASSPFSQSPSLFYTTYQAGSVYNFSTIELLSPSGSTNGIVQNTIRGTLNINGTIFEPAYFGNNYGNSSLLFTPTTAFFQFPNTILPSLSIQVPFNMQGTLQGLRCLNLDPCTSIPITTWAGNGTADYYFISNPANQYQLERVNYTFSTPEPTPEPSTILLLGTGLLGILGYARKRKKSI